MRIAFSGSGGTGKTTTLLKINEDMKLPVIEEGVRKYMKDNKITHLRELSPRDTMKMQMALLKDKQVTESQADFIADRTTIDNFVYANYWCNREDELQRGLNDYMIDCYKHAANSYDYVFLFPWGAIPLEDDGTRSAKPMYQLGIQMMIERAVFQLQNIAPHIYVHTVQSTNLGDRVEEIKTVIKDVEEYKKQAYEDAVEKDEVTLH